MQDQVQAAARAWELLERGRKMQLSESRLHGARTARDSKGCTDFRLQAIGSQRGSASEGVASSGQGRTRKQPDSI